MAAELGCEPALVDVVLSKVIPAVLDELSAAMMAAMHPTWDPCVMVLI
jgi:hypothetical protein